MDRHRGVGDIGQLVRWKSLAAAFIMDLRGDSLCKGKPERRGVAVVEARDYQRVN